MNLEEINKAWEKLPPAGSVELYAILHAEELAEFRSQFDQKVAECIFKEKSQ